MTLAALWVERGTFYQLLLTAIDIQCFLCSISDSDISEVPDSNHVL